MNTDTGQIYREQEAIEAAKLRGEPITQVSERVADAVEIGMEALNRAERRAQQFKRNANRLKNEGR